MSTNEIVWNNPPVRCGCSKMQRYPIYNTDLGNIGGMEEQSIYGAQIDTNQLKPSYFEKSYTEVVEAPWLAQKQEWTYMNRTKPLNEAPVETYKTLKLSSIPSQKYETYKPIIYTTEGFDGMETSNTKFLVFLIMISVVGIILWQM